jgi:hypothetical protein
VVQGYTNPIVAMLINYWKVPLGSTQGTETAGISSGWGILHSEWELALSGRLNTTSHSKPKSFSSWSVSGSNASAFQEIFPFQRPGVRGPVPTTDKTAKLTTGRFPRAIMISAPWQAFLISRESCVFAFWMVIVSICVSYPFALIICSACLREVSVSLAPLNIRATSSVRSWPTTARMLVRVRPPQVFFSIT